MVEKEKNHLHQEIMNHYSISADNLKCFHLESSKLRKDSLLVGFTVPQFSSFLNQKLLSIKKGKKGKVFSSSKRVII